MVILWDIAPMVKCVLFSTSPVCRLVTTVCVQSCVVLRVNVHTCPYTVIDPKHPAKQSPL